MAYFARDDKRHNSPARKQGKYVGDPAPIPELAKPVTTRDEYIAQSISAMQPKDSPTTGGGVLRFVSGTDALKQPTRNKNHKPDNDIFGPPVLAPTPRQRIRIGVTDEELSKIWAEDDRKAKAQSSMEQGSTLVEKMVRNPVNPVVPSHKPKDAAPPPRKQVHLLSETMEERNRQNHEPMGFAGMGSNCRDTGRQGRMCKPQEDFIPPELKLKPRNEGRRTRFPKDTFSFQDDNQTL